MRVINDNSGCPIDKQSDYPIAANTEVKEGQVAVMSGGFVTKAGAAPSGAIIGIVAENHLGTADALNPRANGKRVYINDGPAAVYASKAPVMTASSGGSTTSVVLPTDTTNFANDDFNGGTLVLVDKGTSALTEAVGTQIAITDFTASTGAFTVATLSAVPDGAKFAVYPPFGFKKGNLNTDRTGFIYTATPADSGTIALKVVGADFNREEIHAIAALHELAGKEA